MPLSRTNESKIDKWLASGAVAPQQANRNQPGYGGGAPCMRSLRAMLRLRVRIGRSGRSPPIRQSRRRRIGRAALRDRTARRIAMQTSRFEIADDHPVLGKGDRIDQ